MTDAETCNPPDPICLSETHLARRWNKSTRTLQRWRAQATARPTSAYAAASVTSWPMCWPSKPDCVAKI